MKATRIFLGITGLLLMSCTNGKMARQPQNAITSGVAWFDQNNKEVNAHGTCVVKEGDLYYMFGEHKSDTSNAFTGFACYSSPDLKKWKFENVVLPRQQEGLLGPDRVGERPKVMKCPSTGEYVMYMHCDNLGYKDQYIGYATCNTIQGDYQFHGPVLMNGKPVRKWDMGTFQDTDGKGYLLTHSGFIYALADDYKSVDSIVVQNVVHGESPAMFKHKGTYYWMVSNLTSWERNDNSYLTAPSLKGPWTKKGCFAPEGTLTWNSQTTFVLPVYNETDTMFVFMGDRWSYPMQGSAATYVWQPITLSDGGMSIPEFHQSWEIDFDKASWNKVEPMLQNVSHEELVTTGTWKKEDKSLKSNEKGATLSYSFRGRQIAVCATSNKESGYAKLTLSDEKGTEVLSTYLDLYSKYELTEQKFVSPVLEDGNYRLDIEVAGIHPVWTDKSKTIYGSTDDYVTINAVSILE